MASSTTNLDLTLPVGGENVSRQIINANNVKIDEAVGPVPSGTDLQSEVESLNNKMFPSGEGTNVLTATDFNTMVEIKNYFISTNSVAAACANRPCNTAGKLCAWTINGNSFDQTWQYGGQIYYAIDGKVYQRTVGTNGSKQLSFGSWQELAQKSDTSIGMQRIASGSDADNLYSDNMRVAFYAASYQVTHLPTADWYFIMSFRAETSYITQIAFGMTGTGIYWRRYNVGTVGATWEKIV